MPHFTQRTPATGRWRWARWAAAGCCCWGLLAAPAVAGAVDDWLSKTQEATRGRAYTGTLVVSAGDELSVSKVWHVCDRTTQMERVDSLSGPARTTIRRNSDVITFVHDKKIAYTDQREALGLLPMRWRANGESLDRLYRLREAGVQRVAGHDAKIVELLPHDASRWGYRIWTEAQTGVVIKLQTLDGRGAVLEQVAYTELHLGAVVSMQALEQRMKSTEGYVVKPRVLKKNTWPSYIKAKPEPVLGFSALSCYQRTETDTPALPGRAHCVFTDGLASVSVFVEPMRADAPFTPTQTMRGATQVVTQALGPYWVSAMGEAPPETLQRLSKHLLLQP
ncbi:RseB Negative regulator of sigma E activity [Burkholderiaceae bacterium]